MQKGVCQDKEMRDKILVVMPAYNAAKTIEKTLNDIPQGVVDEIILVDDASTDNTVEIARKLGLSVIVHSKNMGYGANQKTCYSEALKRGTDIIVMVHPDYQYDSRLIPFMIGFIQKDVCDIVLGSRIRTRKEALQSEMPFYKYLSNRFLTLIENIILGLNLSEFHTGYRVYSRKVLEAIPYGTNSDGFVFDSEMLIQAAYFGFRIGDVPVPCRYMEDASEIDFKNGLIYGLGTLWTLVKYVLQKLGFIRFKMFIRTDGKN